MRKTSASSSRSGGLISGNHVDAGHAVRARPAAFDGALNYASKAYQGNVSRTRQLPATGRIPAHRDANGNFYYPLNHLEMTRRAWQAAKDFDEL